MFKFLRKMFWHPEEYDFKALGPLPRATWAKAGVDLSPADRAEMKRLVAGAVRKINARKAGDGATRRTAKGPKIKSVTARRRRNPKTKSISAARTRA